MDTRVGGPPELDARLAGWVAAGLISAGQAEAIARFEMRPQPGPPPAPAPRGPAPGMPTSQHRRSVLVEALVYLGSAVVLAALVIVTAGYWYAFDRAARIAIPAAATVVLVAGGAAVPQRLAAMGSRVRGLLWLLSAATAALLLVVLVDVPSISAETGVLLVAAGVFGLSVVLWVLHRTPAQQLAAFAAAELLAIAAVVRIPVGGGVPEGVALGATALLWGLLAVSGSLPGGGRYLPALRRVAAAAQDSWQVGAPQRRWGLGLASVGAVVSAIVLAAQQGWPAAGIVPVALAVAAAIAFGDLVMLGIAAAGTMVVLPMVVGHYFDSTLSVALVLLATGGVLIGLALLVARRHRMRRERAR